MICDFETGICGVAGEEEMEIIDLNQPKKSIDLYYVTDPICSHCWAIEPALRRFVAQYGDYFHFHTVMGGLLEKWHERPTTHRSSKRNFQTGGRCYSLERSWGIFKNAN